MKKIGTTSSGTLIVEMSAETFHALSQLLTASQLHAGSSDFIGLPTPAVENTQAANTATPEKLAFIKKRILKLKPKKKAGLIRSIAAMFQFKGGIPEQEIQTIIKNLQKEKILVIDENKRVAYKKT